MLGSTTGRKPRRCKKIIGVCVAGLCMWLVAFAGGRSVLRLGSGLAGASDGPGLTQPAISPDKVVDAATLDPARGIAGGAWVTIFGSNLAPKTRTWEAADFRDSRAPTSLEGVSVLINQKPAFVAFLMRGSDFGLSYDQINVLAPRDEALGAVPVQVSTPVGSSAPVMVNKVALVPALFPFEPGQRRYLAATTPDGVEYIGKFDLFDRRYLGRPLRPARAGEIVTLYGSGFGPTDPVLPEGSMARSAAPLATPVTVRFGAETAGVEYAGAAPGLVGVYQFNVRVPQLPPGDTEVIAEIGGSRTPLGRYLITAEPPYPTFDHNQVSDFRLTGAHMFADCTGCHINSRFFATPRDCAACHLPDYRTTRNPNHEVAGFPQNCATCHTTSRFLGAAQGHPADRFPLTGAHTTLQCARCHTGGQFTKLETACASCHLTLYEKTANPNHIAAGFSRDCAVCHNTAKFTGASIDHSLTKLPLTGTHQKLPCASCHSGGQFRGLSADCATCHQTRYAGAANHASSGYPTDCTLCHTTTTWKGAQFAHVRFPLSGRHQTTQCAACHTGGRYAGTPTDCASCHLARYNVTTSPNHAAAAFPRDCAVCHTTVQWRGAVFSHARFALTGAHQRVQCASCHAAGRYAGTPTDCASCHLARYNAAVSPNHVAAAFPRDCALCHTTLQWRGAVFSHARFALTGAHQRVQCASCHAAGRYAGTPTDCASCHLARYNVTTSPNHAAAAFPRDCALCHTTLQWRGASFSHARFALTGAHQQVQCANCHAAGRYAGTPTECASCHLARYNAAVSPNHVAAAFPRDCALCHNTVRWRGVVFSHSRFPIYSGTHATKWSSCASCHVNPSNFKDFSCLGCHAKTRTDDKHRQVRGYAYVSAACYSCHPTGKD